MILPNFLIIGAEKSGTSSLYQYLRLHPQVFMSPIKEPTFFAYDDQIWTDNRWARTRVITRFKDYVALFEGAVGKPAVGEASTMYLTSNQAPAKIKHYIPEAKLIAILRNPIDRAYSGWQMQVRKGTEKITDFAKAIQVRATMRDGTVRQRYVYGGKYFSLLRPYYDLFDSSQICILLFDQLCSDPQGLCQKVYRFLDVDPAYVPSNSSEQYNEGGLWRDRYLGLFFQKIYRVYPYFAKAKTFLPLPIQQRAANYHQYFRRRSLVKPPKLSPEQRAELKELFRDDILLLQDFIHQDLSVWL